MTTNSPTPTTSSRHFGKYAEYLVAGLLLLISLVVVVSFFERLPIEGTSLAIDWHGLWPGLRNGQITYAPKSGLLIAPWDAVLVVPLGFFSFRSSWGLLILLTTAILVASVPRQFTKQLQWLSIFLLVCSWPSLRHAADGNFEGLVIAGTTLIVYSFRKQNPICLGAGILLVTAKPQESWLLVVTLGIWLLRTWPPHKWLLSGLVIIVAALPSFLLLGGAWLDALGNLNPPPGSIMDSSLSAALFRIGIGSWFAVTAGRAFLIGITAYVLWVGGRTLSREKAAMLICLSLLIAPYAAGNSFLTILAIGIIPFFQTRRRLGLALIVLTDLPFLMPRDVLFWWSAYYWTGMLLLVWGIFCWQIYKNERKPQRLPQPIGEADFHKSSPDQTGLQG